MLTREQEPEPEVTESVDQDPTTGRNKRAHSPEVEGIQADTKGLVSKRARFLIGKQGAADDVIVNGNYKKAYVEDDVEHLHKSQAHKGPEQYSHKRTRSDDEMEDSHQDKRTHVKKPHHRTPPSSFGLFSEDEETEDDEQTERARQWERERASQVGNALLSSASLVAPGIDFRQFVKLLLTIYSRRQRSHNRSHIRNSRN